MILPSLQVPAWRSIPGLVHAFFGRAGGVSTGDLASLNLGAGVGDDRACLDENWRRVRRAVPEVRILTPRQVHGTKVAAVAAPSDEPGAADALCTRDGGIALGVLTADCVPLLLVAPAAHVAAVVHAGWRGTVAGIVRIAVEESCRRYGIRSADLHVAQGPAIGGCCYEVEAGIGASLQERWGTMPDAWRRCGERGMLDLRHANRQILIDAGVPAQQICDVGPCTACRAQDYFSHRRSGGRAGRQLSVIGWI